MCAWLILCTPRLNVFVYIWCCVSKCVCLYQNSTKTKEWRRRRKRTCQQRAEVLITYWSNLADDSLKRWRAAQCTVQKKREETIYCSRVPQTLIFASLNVYHQFLALEPCSTALLYYNLFIISWLCFTFIPHCLPSSDPSHLICVISPLTFSLCLTFTALSSLWFSVNQWLSFSHMLWHLCLKWHCLIFWMAGLSNCTYFSPYHLPVFMSPSLGWFLRPVNCRKWL